MGFDTPILAHCDAARGREESIPSLHPTRARKLFHVFKFRGLRGRVSFRVRPVAGRGFPRRGVWGIGPAVAAGFEFAAFPFGKGFRLGLDCAGFLKSQAAPPAAASRLPGFGGDLSRGFLPLSRHRRGGSQRSPDAAQRL